MFANDYAVATGTGIAVVYDADGNLVDDTQTFEIFVDDAVYDADGNYVMTGNADLGNTVQDAVTRKYDPELHAAVAGDLRRLDAGRPRPGRPRRHGGNVYVVGTTYRTGRQGNGFIAVYDGDGSPLWGDEYNTMDIDLEEGWRAVATDATGDVVVVGFAPVLGQQNDGFVRKYHPL